MENSDQISHVICFRDWMDLQERDLSELLHSLTLTNGNVDDDDDNVVLRDLINKTINHFEDYVHRRAGDAPADVSPYFCSAWCSSLEGSMLWAGGCRPSMFIRLIYALFSTGDVLQFCLADAGDQNAIGDDELLSADQLVLINSLQLTTIQEEDRISRELASLQEEVADQPIVFIARDLLRHRDAGDEADAALEVIDVALTKILLQADNLRLNTLKELLGMLTPIQGVRFLAMAKKLHLCFHQWGQRKDHLHGRN
ncbi:protein DELAY OF GERMINATION 1-like [Andrographis paniculata]|uniref:protein DELAY OF GERMINATION 1-like n=1 Tax=Andrographis paniculata TaxID=175694 RepID=UPI0021E863FD|nr:protein DELAY OF GERMINATION 1-like [Andrographis paniculata]